MDEKTLLEWKTANAEMYSKFKFDLEKQLQQPSYQTILDICDDDAEPLKSVLSNIIAIQKQEATEMEELWAKAVEDGDSIMCCTLCYILLDDGADRLVKAFEEKTEDPDTQELIQTVNDYKRFHDRNRSQETPERANDELNLLSLRRWHYDHPQEYSDFIALFRKAYDGDMTFLQNNFSFLMEFLSFKGTKGMMKVVASLIPGNKHYEQNLTAKTDNPLTEQLSQVLDSSLNNEVIRQRLLHKNPYLFSFYYWIVFENGFLHAADLISESMLKKESPLWQKMIGQRAVQALIQTSIDKSHYSKAQWKELTKRLKKGEVKQVISSALLEVEGHRGRKSTYALLEEMVSPQSAPVLTKKIEKVLSEWKELEDTDSVLAYIFAALVEGGLTNADYNYRTFHAAMREKFPVCHISEGYDWAEALYYAITRDGFDYNISISEEQIKKGRKHVQHIRTRFLAALNPDIDID